MFKEKAKTLWNKISYFHTHDGGSMFPQEPLWDTTFNISKQSRHNRKVLRQYALDNPKKKFFKIPLSEVKIPVTKNAFDSVMYQYEQFGGFLAGGFLLKDLDDILEKVPRAYDYDIFFTSSENFYKALKFYGTFAQNLFSNKKRVQGYMRTEGDQKIEAASLEPKEEHKLASKHSVYQLIKVDANSLWGTLQAFDISICRVAADKDYLYCTRDFIHCFCGRMQATPDDCKKIAHKITTNSDGYFTSSSKQTLRIGKYYSYGYLPPSVIKKYSGWNYFGRTSRKAIENAWKQIKTKT